MKLTRERGTNPRRAAVLRSFCVPRKKRERRERERERKHDAARVTPRANIKGEKRREMVQSSFFAAECIEEKARARTRKSLAIVRGLMRAGIFPASARALLSIM